MYNTGAYSLGTNRSAIRDLFGRADRLCLRTKSNEKEAHPWR